MNLIRSRRLAAALFATSMIGAAPSVRAQTPAVPPAAEPADAPPSELMPYAMIGTKFAQTIRLGELGWTEQQYAAFVSGVRAAYAGGGFEMDAAGQRLFADINRRIAEAAPPRAASVPPNAELVQRFLERARTEFGVEELDSGLHFRVLQGGTGPRPGPEDTVVISYAAKAPDWKTDFPQLSIQRQRTKISDLLPGLAEGLQMLPVDARAMLVLPPTLSFGDGTWPPGIPRGIPLIFIVDLHEVIPADGSP